MASSLTRPRLAIAGMFFVNGALFATWASRIPSVKEAAALSDARLGLVLSALGVGVFLGLPLSAWLIARLGSGFVVISSALACCLAVPAAGNASGFWMLILTLPSFGAALGSMDVAMNSQAALLERDAGRSIMASFHGLWSLGGLLGAMLGGAFAARAYSPSTHFQVVCAVLALVALAASRGLVRDTRVDQPAAPLLAWPSRAVWAIGLVGSCGAVVEGSVAEWSGVYLRDALGTSVAFSALGYAAFSLAMMVGRFTGDALIDRFGHRALLRFGAALSGIAVTAAVASADARVALVAFALAGLGMSTVFPIVFSAAGSLRGDSPGHAIAAVATMSYGAGLLAPPVIGFTAGAASLPVALGLLVPASGVMVALASRFGHASIGQKRDALAPP